MASSRRPSAPGPHDDLASAAEAEAELQAESTVVEDPAMGAATNVADEWVEKTIAESGHDPTPLPGRPRI